MSTITEKRQPTVPSSCPGKVAVFFTGGTIGMRHAPDGAVRPALHLADLLTELPDDAFASHTRAMDVPVHSLLLPVEWADLPSPHMTPELMFRLAGDVQTMLNRPDIAGAVITHGTDVFELFPN